MYKIMNIGSTIAIAGPLRIRPGKHLLVEDVPRGASANSQILILDLSEAPIPEEAEVVSSDKPSDAGEE